MSGVRLHGVGKRYGRGNWILRDVELEIAPGKVFAFMGANGSGKSTLLRIIAGLRRPSVGTVFRAQRTVGYVPERFETADRMTAGDYLRHIGRIAGLSTVDSAVRSEELLTRLGLLPGPQARMRELSKGNAQKLAIAAALLPRPGVLVLDEPWSGLDSAAQQVLSALIAECAEDGCCVAFAAHEKETALTDSLLHIANGTVG